MVHLFNNMFALVLSYTPLDYESFWNLSNPWALTLTIIGAVGFVVSIIIYLCTTQSCWEQASKKAQSKQNQAENENAENTDTISNGGIVVNTKTYSVVFLVFGIVVCGILWVAKLLS